MATNTTHRLAGFTFPVTPSQPQTYTVAIRRTSDPDNDVYYSIVKNDLLVLTTGAPSEKIIFTGLQPDTSYTAKFTNNGDTSLVYKQEFTTGLPYGLGDNPYKNAVWFIGQAVDIWQPNLFQDTLPPLEADAFYFTLESNFREAYGSYGNLVPEGAVVLKKYLDAPDPAGDGHGETGAYIPDTASYLHTNPDNAPASKLHMARMFDPGGANDLSYFMAFYIEALPASGQYLYPYFTSTADGQNAFYLRIDSAGQFTITSIRNGGTPQVIAADSNLAAGKWYKFFMRFDHATPANNDIQILGYAWHETITFTNKANLTQLPIGNDQTLIYWGASVSGSTVTGSAGLIVKRIYARPVYITDNNVIYHLTDYLNYNIKVVFKLAQAPQTETIVSDTWQLKLDDARISFTVPTDIPPAQYNVFVHTPVNERPSQLITVIQFAKSNADFDLDFTADFDGARTQFATLFRGFHGQWGGANGGASSDNIYTHRGNKSLILEAHGDNYAGTIQGVDRVALTPTSTGYGPPKYHTIPGDPLLGQPWKTRVGGVVTSADYYGYGELTVNWKIPAGLYGVAPAIWFFHYIELYPADPRYQYWLDRGFLEQGGGTDKYLVVNNEIDIELPSHLYMGKFATWVELLGSYFDPTALDDKYHVVVNADPDTAKNGLFRLVTVAAPNQFSSWVKVSNTWDEYNTPTFAHCKFNNWIGEKGGGGGWAYTQAEYAGEQYLALLTDLATNYADGQYHAWTIKWYKNRTELWVDGQLKRTNRTFVPFIPGRITIGPWFPSGVSGNSPTPWLYDPARAWAGYPAAWEAKQVEVKRITYRHYESEEAGGVNELHPETYPESNLRILIP